MRMAHEVPTIVALVMSDLTTSRLSMVSVEIGIAHAALTLGWRRALIGQG